MRHHWSDETGRLPGGCLRGLDLNGWGGDMALPIGMAAPDFTLPSHGGRRIRLGQFRATRNVVLAFFPLAWTPI